VDEVEEQKNECFNSVKEYINGDSEPTSFLKVYLSGFGSAIFADEVKT
jgi:hypothetical protein